MSILSGIRILDFTHYISGPYCSQILSDHGADVIKIERIEGEVGRIAGPFHEDTSLYFAAQNRNKRGLSIDLKSEQGREIIHRLIKTADLLITNYGAGVPERLGIDYQTISEINPKISMVHITGFGLTGPYKNYGAYDGTIQAMSGLAELTGHMDGPPTNVGFYIADHLSGLQAAMGAMLALVHKERTGTGKYVDVSMLDGMLSLLGYHFSEVMLKGIEPQRIGNRDPLAFCNTYPTKDGYIFIAPAAQHMWEKLCRIIGKNEWLNSDSPFNSKEGRMENRDVLEKMVSEWTIQYTKEEVFQLLQNAGIACGPVNTLIDIINNPQIKDRNMVQKMNMGEQGDAVFVTGVPIKINDTNVQKFSPPPAIGEHSDEILAELGYSMEEIERYLALGVVSSAKK
ncbi:CaiB/BaiF CoA transferase family protein [Neobacillus rhizophilus]|uniref:CoA transferase n=1 Tax=Neobacillus rhizophilus TaxID=2833579 RepID=A0A942YTH2_9BACI|nr:CoA transferase [Neobacillus rhizophilus]MBS4210930.1 CoA transferase [Neobacillus rhizophilus]